MISSRRCAWSLNDGLTASRSVETGNDGKEYCGSGPPMIDTASDDDKCIRYTIICGQQQTLPKSFPRVLMVHVCATVMGDTIMCCVIDNLAVDITAPYSGQTGVFMKKMLTVL